MNEIVVPADVHEGIKFSYRVDPETGLSEREMDIHQNLKRVVSFAVEKKSSYFVILGDLFERTHIPPIYRELIRKDVIEPLAKEGIKIWIIAGNHDQPRISARGTSIDDFEAFPNVTIYKSPAVKLINLKGKQIACIILPYMDEASILKFGGKEATEEARRSLAKQIIKNWLFDGAKTQADYKILFSHYWVEGAKIREGAWEIKPGEFAFDLSMIPKVDLSVFGHIHLHQKISRDGKTILYPGSVERIDWGEREERKGFISLSPLEKRWEFIELPTREMLQLEIAVREGEEPERKLAGSLPNATGKLVRIKLSLPEGGRSRISKERVDAMLKDAFHYELKLEERIQAKQLPSFTANPFELLEGFINSNYEKHPKREDLLKEGRKILEESLE